MYATKTRRQLEKEYWMCCLAYICKLGQEESEESRHTYVEFQVTISLEFIQNPWLSYSEKPG